MKAVDHELFSPKKCDVLRKKIGIADDEFVIGWVGRLTAQMEIEETFDVFETLLKKNQKKNKNVNYWRWSIEGKTSK